MPRRRTFSASLPVNGSLTRYRANKYGALAGFYRYAISRGYARRSPLPARDDEPKRPRPAASHVYSRNELQRLFSAIDVSRRRAFRLDADTLRALLLLLYGAGLRLGEAQRLTLDDADLNDALLTIRNTKFYKTRLVPVCPQLADALRSLCRQACPAAFAERHGLHLPRQPQWHTRDQKHRQDRVRQAAPGGRNQEPRPAASPVPSLPAPCRGRSPAGVVVPAGRRRPAVAAGALHLARSRGSRRHPGLPVHDTRTTARGFGPLQHLCQRRRP